VRDLKEYRISWYVTIDEKCGVEGRSLLKGEKIDDVILHIKEKLSKEYFVRPSSVHIIDSNVLGE